LQQTKDALTELAQAFAHCRLDYCNAIMAKTARNSLPVVSGFPRREYISRFVANDCFNSSDR